MRELNPEDIDTLVCIKGMIIRCGSEQNSRPETLLLTLPPLLLFCSALLCSAGIIPEMKTAYFECITCRAPKEVNIENGEVRRRSRRLASRQPLTLL